MNLKTAISEGGPWISMTEIADISHLIIEAATSYLG